MTMDQIVIVLFFEVSEWAFYYGLLNSRPHVLGRSLQVNKCIQAMYWIYLNSKSEQKQVTQKLIFINK
jgi:hypothetical protein